MTAQLDGRSPTVPVDFKEQLQRQLRFIEASARGFDNGLQDEAVRIAVTIRVLVHQTQHSTSLLTHLNAQVVELLSTAGNGPNTPVGFAVWYWSPLTGVPGLGPTLAHGPEPKAHKGYGLVE